jgi:hypothetical protein
MATNEHHDDQRDPGTTPPKRTRAKKATTTSTTAEQPVTPPSTPAASTTAAAKKTATRTTAATKGATPTATAAPAPVADPIAQIDEILAAELQRASVIEPQMRMLMRALRDCGLGVSADDVRIDETTRKVTITLSWAATKQLTSDLQDIAEERPIVVVAPPDGPTLFDPLPPAGPVAPQQAGSGLHIEVPA